MKHNLRAHIRSLRKTLTQSAQDDQAIAELFLTHIKPQKDHIIASYEKMGSEINPKPIMDAAPHLTFVMPEIVGEHIKFAKTPDIIITPLIAFDREGHRLGQGGGFFDRYFTTSTALKVGLAFAQQEVPHIPAEAHDQKLDWIITPNEAIKT